MHNPFSLKSLRMRNYRYAYLNAPRLNHTTPVDVSLELTSHCNMSCVYCYHGEKEVPFEKGFMDRQLAFKLVMQAAELGVYSMKFNYRGEATLNPSYRDITHLCKSMAHDSTFIDRLTNSNFKIPPAKREDIFQGLANLTKVKVSYDSFMKSVFEKQRAGGDHELTTQNIDLFYNHPARIKSNTEIVIQAVRTQLNRDEDIEGLVKLRWPNATTSIRDMVAGRTDKDLSGLENRIRDTSNRQACLQANARLIIHHDGRVGPCCPDIGGKLILGDAKTQTLYDIFNSTIAKQLRKDLKDKSAFTKSPCSTCPSFETYRGFKPSKDS